MTIKINKLNHTLKFNIEKLNPNYDLILINQTHNIVTFSCRAISNSIYHNISSPHPRRRPQRVSAASGAFPAPFTVHSPEKRP